MDRTADNAEGVEIPRFVIQTFAALPAIASELTVPNYIETVLSGTQFIGPQTKLGQADMDTLRTFCAQVHGRHETFLFHDCVCRFESERLVVRQLTTVAYRLQSVRIVSLTY